jgi:HD-GYP domain-containing protein (c-di-GMP phosphodiesterase class II)
VNQDPAMGEASLLTQAHVAGDPDEAGHAARVTALALRVARAIGAEARRIRAIEVGGPLHDIGKLALDPALLRKPAPLAPHEVDEIRQHPELGVRMLDAGALRDAADCVLHHHERWDGGGYPHGLAGEEIPVEARILAVADAYDAMTSHRPYRPALTHEEAVVEVERCAGTQFDPAIARAFLAIV